MCIQKHNSSSIFRNKKFEGVSKSEVVGYNEEKQRIRYLCFGDPPLGKNGGNTAANTHRVLQIIRTAQRNKSNHGDGGWKEALCVSLTI